MQPSKQDLIDVILNLIQKTSINNLSHCQIAQACECKVESVYTHFPSKIRLITGIFDYFIANAHQLQDHNLDQLSEQDRLFEIIISFFESNESNKSTIEILISQLIVLPQYTALTALHMRENFKQTLVSKGILLDGTIKNQIVFNGLLMVIIRLYYIWISNKNNDINTLMQELDKLLNVWQRCTSYLH